MDLAKEEAEMTLAIFIGRLLVNIRVFFFLLLIPNQFSWIISTQSLPSSFLLSFQNIGTYINITCESFGSSLDIFTSVFLNCSPPL